MKHVGVIGAGFAGIAAATCLAADGYHVTVYEKNKTAGGRASQFTSNGFRFDMGPSWYWMPDVFEKYFQRFGRRVTGYYQLKRLDPSYRVVFGKGDYVDLPAGIDALTNLFEQIEPGAGRKLQRFLEEGWFKYDMGMNNIVFKPGLSVTELFDSRLAGGLMRMHIFTSISTYIRKFFKSSRLIRILEFPVLFLGATPRDTPALYSLMNYADMALGTWYPEGGMYSVVAGMVKLAEEYGVKFKYGTAIDTIEVHGGRAQALIAGQERFKVDVVVAAADYEHVEQKLLPAAYRRYTPGYWDKRVMAPSSLLFFIGLNKKLDGIQHHTLFFDQDFDAHARDIYKNPRWPEAPQFYVSCTSVTDPGVAPAGHENLVVLIPVAPGLQDSEFTRDHYYNMVMARFEQLIGQSIRPHVVFKRSYAHRDFIADYNAFKGNAYGLANTIWQTANFKPSMINKKVANLFYTGQLTVPGPGVPPAIISGQVVARILVERAG
jgi:phytoene desaturase